MVKVKDRAKLLWCLRQFDHGKATQKWLCTYLGIKPRRFRQIYSIYKQTRTVPDFGSKVGRPAKKIPAEWTKIVEDQYSKQRLNAYYLEKVICKEQKLRIPHNTIHKIMLEKRFAIEQQSKKKRRKPWIRYERAVLKEVLENGRSMFNLSIRECISDHGTQFYADKRDKLGRADQFFEGFLREWGVKQILCGVNHPQTNGKVEKC